MIMARMPARFAAFVIWAAVAASAVFWALRLWSAPIATPSYATVVATAGAFQGDTARVLGSDAAPATPAVLAPAPADARFKLVGVVAPRVPGGAAPGVALIATDGKPAKAYRVGSAVDGELVLLAVRTRAASLGPRGQPAQVELQLPALPPATSGAAHVVRPGAAVGARFVPPPPLAAGAETDDGEPQAMPRAPANPERAAD